jgi:drug/metabolite transporter (DMT)-like permease
MPETSHSAGNTWLWFALLTVCSWGVYGVFLHTGTMGIADPAHGRIKAFLIVGLAYFLTAVLLPVALLAARGASWAFWTYPAKGLWWSLIAGTVGAIGALGVLLAFGAKGTPAVVMSIVFAGAPIVNALYSIILHPPEGGWSAIRPQFFLGIALAAVGGCLVTFYKPNPPAPKAKPAAVQAAAGAPVQR